MVETLETYMHYDFKVFYENVLKIKLSLFCMSENMMSYNEFTAYIVTTHFYLRLACVNNLLIR